MNISESGELTENKVAAGQAAAASRSGETHLQTSSGTNLTQIVDQTTTFIARVQDDCGAIPWFEKSIVDPWDHVEAAMGLAIGGRLGEAKAAYRWLARTQNEDGSWFAAYRDGQPADQSRVETNFVAYVATGVWHLFLINRDVGFLAEMWATVNKAMTYVLRLQSAVGEIYWAVDIAKGVDHDALVTGCCSIYKSLDCSIRIADTLNHPSAELREARLKLGHALRFAPERFDRSWPSKARYSMDWFYPVLSGVLQGKEATQRLDQRWSEFVEAGIGCRCVVDEPWVTVAETCELIMSLCATGDSNRGKELFRWIQRFQCPDGSWWTGFVTRDDTLWPDERPTWTAGAVLLAIDMLYETTPGHQLFHVEQGSP